MKLAIVTGGSRGLGLAVCEALIADGYRVIEFSRTAPHPFSVRVDLSLPLESRRVVAAAIASIQDDTLNHLVVISNAGTLDPIGPTSSKRPEDVAANLNTNLVSAVECVTAIIARFQSMPCSKLVVNISSGAAGKAYAGASLYCAAKAGMEAFVRSLALEQRLQPHPFTAINIEPGVIDTDMQARLSESSPSDFPEAARFAQRRDSGGLSSPAETARRVLRIMSSPSLMSGGRYSVDDVSGN